MTTKRTARKQQRTMYYGTANGLLYIDEPTGTTTYFVTQAETRSKKPTYRLDKARGNTGYNVLLDGANSLCDCLGFERFGMNTKDGKGCKHVAALTKLLQLGKLTPEVEPEPEVKAERQPQPKRENAYVYGAFGDEDIDGFCAP